jgi:hypothetical protein
MSVVRVLKKLSSVLCAQVLDAYVQLGKCVRIDERVLYRTKIVRLIICNHRGMATVLLGASGSINAGNLRDRPDDRCHFKYLLHWKASLVADGTARWKTDDL